MGAFAVQIAKTLGAEVTAVYSSSKQELARTLGADHVIPVIDKHYPLHETADAMRYLEAGHATGTIIITVD